MAEREAAAALLAGDTSKGSKAHGRAIVSADERSAMRRWGWFVAVWGQKPADGLVPASEEDEEEEEEESERWWGLWQADEIRKLADWIASDTQDEAPSDDGSDTEAGVGNAQMRVDEDGRVIPTSNELEALVGALREYAEVLDWRAWRMEEESGSDGKENGAAKEKTAARIKTVSPANFYGPR
jgi:hypothetical protein